MLDKKCRMCQQSDFKEVINFGDSPLVNSLIEESDLDKTEEVYPLVVEQCQNCHLVQIVNPIDAHKIYKEQDYLYYSGDMPKLEDYFRTYAEDLKKRFIEKGDLAVEIGSNDGIMLKLLWDKAIALGVDPATNVVVRALANGIPTISDFFTSRLAQSIVKEFGHAKVVYGNNCIAHLRDLRDLMDGVKLLLRDNGVFVVECNYWGGMVKNKNYALIYHDHFSYFSLQNWVDFLKEYDMSIFDAVVTPAQGGSLRLFANPNGKRERKMTDRCLELLAEEQSTNLNSYETCEKYREEVMEEALKLGNLIKTLKSDNKVIAGYGAAAKGFSILKLAGIDERQLDFFVDDSPAKQGKYTPVSHIPVVARDARPDPDYFFITAPNYTDIIIEKEKDKFQGKFILADGTIR